MESHLTDVTNLSHEFGGNMFVKGGGGNSSVKNDDTLWIKPSGTTMETIQSDDFVALKRDVVNQLHTVSTSTSAEIREKAVLEIMTTANMTPDRGRPSVEAPVHNLFEATYVIHTHPTLINGMTCSVTGEATCRELFPEAAWVDYIDPGFTLFQSLKGIVSDYRKTAGRDPDIVFMKNHGVIVAGDSPEAIRRIYRHIVQRLTDCYDQDMNQAHRQFSCKPLNYDANEAGVVTELAEANEFVTVSIHSPFVLAKGPITPDHIVYMKAFPYDGSVTRENLEAFAADRGYFPKVIKSPTAIYILGQSSRDAMLTLEILQDASEVMHLAQTFGGINYMTDRETQFIENWEVESYRRKQALKKT